MQPPPPLAFEQELLDAAETKNKLIEQLEPLFKRRMDLLAQLEPNGAIVCYKLIINDISHFILFRSLQLTATQLDLLIKEVSRRPLKDVKKKMAAVKKEIAVIKIYYHMFFFPFLCIFCLTWLCFKLMHV